MNIATASPDSAPVINGEKGAGEGCLGDAVDACGKEYANTEQKKKVWGVLIDFVDVGRAIDVVDRVNGVKGAVGRKSANDSGGDKGGEGKEGDGGKDGKDGSTATVMPSATHAVEEFKGQAAGVERGVSKAVLGAAAGVCGFLAMC